jgi:hypothetical protein
MHIKIAAEAVIGSWPHIRAISGFTTTTGFSEKRIIRKPITAFQKPTTDQGKVIEKSTRNARPAKLDGGTATTASHNTAAMVTPTSAAKSARRFTSPVVIGPSTGAETPVALSSTDEAPSCGTLLFGIYTWERIESPSWDEKKCRTEPLKPYGMRRQAVLKFGLSRSLSPDRARCRFAPCTAALAGAPKDWS